MEIALFEPEIPPNTGNIIRMTYCAGVSLHIVGRPSFSMEDSMLRRAGLDYWERSQVHTHSSLSAFLSFLLERDGGTEGEVRARFVFTSRFARKVYSDHQFQSNEILMFGRETSGLPDWMRSEFPGEEQWLRIPVHRNCRSLNLANSVGILLFEALRQLDFPGLDRGFRSDTNKDDPVS
jgi:tRNA (cytidine/uridine-2'-O-)-methyltransferase